MIGITAVLSSEEPWCCNLSGGVGQLASQPGGWTGFPYPSGLVINADTLLGYLFFSLKVNYYQNQCVNVICLELGEVFVFFN